MGNWWHYHKWRVLLAVVLLGLAAVLIAGWFGAQREQPDLRVGYVAGTALAEETVARLQTALEALCEDSNGDGRVWVAVEQYIVRFDGTAADANTQMAGMARLSADLRAADGPAIFLLDDPAGIQQSIGALQYLDGTQPPQTPPYDAENWRRMALATPNCPLLAEILPGPLYLARRAEALTPAPPAAEALWQALTE